MKKDIFRELAISAPDDLMHPFGEIVKEAGYDALYSIVHHLGGCTIHIPKLKRIFADIIELEIRRNFTGFNELELAKKYDVTDRYVRRILRGK